MTVGDESVVNGLDVGGVEPDGGTDAGLGDGCEIGAGNDVAECERDRFRLEDDGVRGSARVSDPQFQDRVVAETRALLADTTA